MDLSKKIIIAIVSACVVVIAGVFIGVNWNSLSVLFSGTKIYTYEQIEESYDKGYNDANTNEKQYLEQLNHFKKLYEDNNLELTNCRNQIENLTNSNNNYKSQVEDLTEQKTNLQGSISSLESIKLENEKTIEENNKNISALQEEVQKLESDNNTNTENITKLQNQILTLQSLNTQLQRTNELNVSTITTLNSQISLLNVQISDLTLQVQNNSSNTAVLNNRIIELEKSVAYYEQYISNLENSEQVVATFEFDGSVYNIQIIAKNSLVSVVTPPTNDYVIFNYWTVNGEQVDLTTYQLTANTKFIANVTYKYNVKFMVDSAEHNSQIIVANDYATLPTPPTKNGYEFDGWTINGIDIVDISNISITQNTIFIAKFTKLHNVTFIVNDEVLETKQVRNGECIENANCDYVWTLNGNVIDFAEYPIFADVIFIAKTEISSLKAQSWNGLSNFSGPDVWYFEDNVFYSSGSQQYRLNKETLTWELKTWTGFSPLYGSNVFHLGENVYYLRNRDHYILNKETLIWEPKVWTGLSSSLEYYSIFSDGNVAYLIDVSTIYKLDEENSCCYYLTTFPNSYIHSMYGSSDFFVNDGLLYYSYKPENIDIFFDLEKGEWLNFSWNTPSYFRGYGIWRYKDNLYYSYGNKHLYYDTTTNSWLVKDWDITDFEAYYIWNDGVNLYYSKSITHYIFV